LEEILNPSSAIIKELDVADNISSSEETQSYTVWWYIHTNFNMDVAYSIISTLPNLACISKLKQPNENLLHDTTFKAKVAKVLHDATFDISFILSQK
jgi:hypothetical protein